MWTNGVQGIGLSARKRAHDLGDFGAELDELQGYGVESVELPTFDMDIIVGGKIRAPQLKALQAACFGRGLTYSVHGPLALNLMDEPWRLSRHIDLLKTSIEVTAEVGAQHYVLHNGLVPQQQAAGIDAAVARQREELSKIGEFAAQHDVIVCVETMFSGYVGKAVTLSPKRLAAELAAIAHPNVQATLDFSHAYLKLDYDGRRDAFMDEIKAIAPWARHLHVHDSFGQQDDIWVYTDGERVSFGNGDLHLPVGWGSIPWDRIIDECVFPRGVIFNLEMKDRYWYAVPESVEATKRLAERARTDVPADLQGIAS